jgi:hypothetical protein
VNAKVHQKLVIVWHGFDVRALDRKEAEVRKQTKRQAKDDGVELVWGERSTNEFGSSCRVQWFQHGVLLSETQLLQARVDQIYDVASASILRAVLHSIWFGLRLLRQGTWIRLALQHARAGLIVALLPCMVAGAVLFSVLLTGLVTQTLGAVGMSVLWMILALLFFRKASTRAHALLLVRALTFLNTSPTRYAAKVRAMAQGLMTGVGSMQFDEVVVAGHSIGAHFALINASDWQHKMNQQPGPGRLSLVTMGQSISFSSAAAKGQAFDELFRALDPSLCDGWYDFSSPADCITGLLPNRELFWKISGLTPPQQPNWPTTISSPRFHAHIPEHRYLRIKRSRMKLHMQYIGHTNSPRGFNFAHLAFGPMPIEQWMQAIQSEGA